MYVCVYERGKCMHKMSGVYVVCESVCCVRAYA